MLAFGNDLHRAEQPRRQDGHLRHRIGFTPGLTPAAGADLRRSDRVHGDTSRTIWAGTTATGSHAKEVIGVALCDLGDLRRAGNPRPGSGVGAARAGTSSKIGSASNDHRCAPPHRMARDLRGHEPGHLSLSGRRAGPIEAIKREMEQSNARTEEDDDRAQLQRPLAWLERRGVPGCERDLGRVRGEGDVEPGPPRRAEDVYWPNVIIPRGQARPPQPAPSTSASSATASGASTQPQSTRPKPLSPSATA